MFLILRQLYNALGGLELLEGLTVGLRWSSMRVQEAKL